MASKIPVTVFVVRSIGDEDDVDLIVKCLVTPGADAVLWGDGAHPGEPAEVEVVEAYRDQAGPKVSVSDELLSELSEAEDVHEKAIDAASEPQDQEGA